MWEFLLRMSVRSFKLIMGILLVILGILFLVSVWQLKTIFGFFFVYPWIFSKVSGYGMNQPLTTAISVLVVAILFFGVMRLLFPGRRKKFTKEERLRKRTIAWLILAGLLVVHSAFLFLAGRDRFFSPTGEALKYYTVNPLTHEIQVFDRPIFDAFGQQAKKVTFGVAQDILRQQGEDKFPVVEVPGDKIRNFFDYRTGEALVFYYQDETGWVHFFLQGGFDPLTGRKLAPVTPEAVAVSRQKQAIARQSQEPKPQDVAKREEVPRRGQKKEIPAVISSSAQLSNQPALESWFDCCHRWADRQIQSYLNGAFWIIGGILTILAIVMMILDVLLVKQKRQRHGRERFPVPAIAPILIFSLVFIAVPLVRQWFSRFSESKTVQAVPQQQVHLPADKEASTSAIYRPPVNGWSDYDKAMARLDHSLSQLNKPVARKARSEEKTNFVSPKRTQTVRIAKRVIRRRKSQRIAKPHRHPARTMAWHHQPTPISNRGQGLEAERRAWSLPRTRAPVIPAESPRDYYQGESVKPEFNQSCRAEPKTRDVLGWITISGIPVDASRIRPGDKMYYRHPDRSRGAEFVVNKVGTNRIEGSIIRDEWIGPFDSLHKEGDEE